jgi:hypothetical protein
MEHTTEGTARAWPWMVAGGAAGLTALPLMLLWDRLPDPVAVRWSVSGAPNGPMPKVALLVLCCALLALFAWLASRRTPHTATAESRASAEAGAIRLMAIGGMLMPAIVALCVALNLDRPDWRQAAPLTPRGFGLLFLPTALALILGFAARAFGGPRMPRPEAIQRPGHPTEAKSAPSTSIQSSGSWTGHASNRATLPIIAAIGIASIYLAAQGHLLLASLQVPVMIVLELLSTIQVTVDATGVTVRYGHGGWVRQRIDMERVGSASVTQLGAFSPYGWGYRGSLKLLKRAAVVVRAGTGLRLDLRDGRRFVVTVDDAQSASHLINGFARSGR